MQAEPRLDARAARTRLSVVLIDPDPSDLAQALRAHGHHVTPRRTGLDGLRDVVDGEHDAVIVDVRLPDVGSLEVVRMVRAVSEVPLVVASDRDDDHAVIEALDTGADDYVVEPISVRELDARLRALVRRNTVLAPDIVGVGGLHLDLGRREAHLDGQQLSLTRKLFDLLAYLVRADGRVVPRDELLRAIWSQPFGGPDKTLDVHLSLLRRRLGESAAKPRYLTTQRGIGVRLAAPPTGRRT